jgi:hypothetical protein
MLLAFPRVSRASAIEESRTNLEKLIALAVLDGMARGQRLVSEPLPNAKFSDDGAGSHRQEVAAIPRERIGFDLEALQVGARRLARERVHRTMAMATERMTRQGLYLTKRSALESGDDELRMWVPFCSSVRHRPSIALPSPPLRRGINWIGSDRKPTFPCSIAMERFISETTRCSPGSTR